MTAPATSFVQRMIDALAQIDKLVAHDGAPDPVLSLAPEVVVERVRAHVALADHRARALDDYREASIARESTPGTRACPRCRGRGMDANGVGCRYCAHGVSEGDPR